MTMPDRPRKGIADAQLVSMHAAWGKRREFAKKFEDEEARELAIEKAKRDPVFFIENFLCTFDPRVTSAGLKAWMPFSLYPRQREFIRWVHRCYENGENGVVPKCRGVGASWLLMAFAVWLFCTQADSIVTVGSRKASAVDDRGNIGALLPKAVEMIERMPRWARDTFVGGWDKDVCHTHMKIVHPETGALIEGEVGSKMGRGKRSSFYIWDESAHHDHAVLVDRAVGETTNCLMEISTPCGDAGPFAAKVRMGTVPVFWLRHTTIPHYDEEWLEYRRTVKYKHDPVGYAQEILADFASSDGARAITVEMLDASEKRRIRPTVYRDYPVVLGLDVGLTGDLAALVIRRGPAVLHVASQPGVTGADVARWAMMIGIEWGVDIIAWDAIGVGEGVTSTLNAEAEDVQLLPVKVSHRATNTWWDAQEVHAHEMFANQRAELWWILRERFRRTLAGEGDELDRIFFSHNLPDQLRTELGWIRRISKPGGKIGIEAKKELKKRVGQSPDIADALMIAYASDVLSPPPRSRVARKRAAPGRGTPRLPKDF